MKNMTYALIKLPKTTAIHGWLIPTINLTDLKSLDVSYFVHCNITGKGDLQKDDKMELKIHKEVKYCKIFKVIIYRKVISKRK